MRGPPCLLFKPLISPSHQICHWFQNQSTFILVKTKLLLWFLLPTSPFWVHFAGYNYPCHPHVWWFIIMPYTGLHPPTNSIKSHQIQFNSIISHDHTISYHSFCWWNPSPWCYVTTMSRDIGHWHAYNLYTNLYTQTISIQFIGSMCFILCFFGSTHETPSNIPSMDRHQPPWLVKSTPHW